MNVYVIILAVVVVLALVLGNLWRDVQSVKAVIHQHQHDHHHQPVEMPVEMPVDAEIEPPPSSSAKDK